MSIFSIHLGAPSHAVEPALLAQRLPALTAALQFFCAADAVPSTPAAQASTVHIYAAQLGVQRDHITLECLPALELDAFAALQARAAMLANELAADKITFTANPERSSGGHIDALGVLNITDALPPTTNFIGRDIAKALPRDDAYRVLRQFVNGAQMSLHQTPVQGCLANSVWCGNAVPTDALSRVWLQGGLTPWWDALPAWDADLDVAALSHASSLELVYSDVTICLPLKPLRAWAVWSKPLMLVKVLQTAAN